MSFLRIQSFLQSDFEYAVEVNEWILKLFSSMENYTHCDRNKTRQKTYGGEVLCMIQCTKKIFHKNLESILLQNMYKV